MLESGIRIESITEPVSDDDEGRMSLGMKRVFAAWQHRKIRKVTMSGLYDAAPQAGRYLGGPIPLGYRVEHRKEGKKTTAWYVVNRDLIPGLTLSEADVVEQLFKRADKGEPTTKLTLWLEAIQVPTVYERSERPAPNSRLEKPIWRASRVQAILRNPMYKGSHTYGDPRKKRRLRRNSKFKDRVARDPVQREMPAIVSVELWERVQRQLVANRRDSRRNARRDYLLRTMMTCASCGFRYVAHYSVNTSGNPSFAYRCSGKQNERGTFGPDQQRCPSLNIEGWHAEDVIWAQVERLIRNPSAVVQALEQKAAGRGQSTNRRQIEKLQADLRRKQDAKVNLLKRAAENDFDHATLQQTKALLDKEEGAIRANLEKLKVDDAKLGQLQADLATVPRTLAALRERLDGPLPFAVKRKILETLVDDVQVETVQKDGLKRVNLHVRFRFIDTCEPC